MSNSEENSLSAEDKELIEKYSWMIRPCALYINEYSDCTSLRGRFDQYFSEGKLTDCDRWDRDRFDCRKYTKEFDLVAGVRIIKNEKRKVAERLKSAKDNDVMKERKERPPPNWNAPLPYHLSEQHRDSYLADHLGELMQPYDAPKKFCVIS